MFKMTGYWQLRSWMLAIANSFFLCGALANFTDGASAQITPDTTLGSENSIVTSTGSVDQIDGGATRGINLFHSFQEFNVGEGRAAVFTNPSGIENILTRVTGVNPSNIFGTLGVSGGSANLFLINPNGIVFGANASLNVGGSFVASTASSLNFADGIKFSATAPQTTPLLTVSVPVGLQYGQTVGDIRVHGSTLNVPFSKTLALLGGNLIIENNVALQAPKSEYRVSFPVEIGETFSFSRDIEIFGDIELGSVASSSLVSLTKKNQGWSVGYEGVKNFLNIQLSQVLIGSYWHKVKSNDKALYSPNYSTNTNVQITGKDVSLINTLINSKNFILKAEQFIAQGSSLKVGEAPLFKSFEYPEGDVGSVFLTVSDLIKITDTSIISTGNFSQTPNVIINTAKLVLQDDSAIGIYSFTRANPFKEVLQSQGGNISVAASASIELIDSVISSAGAAGFGGVEGEEIFPENFSASSPGNVNITTGRLTARDGARIVTGSAGGFTGGNITISASEFVRVAGVSPKYGFSSNITATYEGDVIENYKVLGILPPTFSFEFASGKGGDIVINTPQLSLEDTARISASATETGNAGNIEVNAFSAFLENQSGLLTETESGLGGEITLRTQDLLLLRGNSQISTTAGKAQSGGDGGDINLDTDLLLSLENSDITANAFEGRGGNVQINTQGLFLSSDSDITATSELGLNGLIEVNTPRVNLSRGIISLPAVAIDTQVSQACTPGSSQSNSEFVVTGRGGSPPSPEEALSSDAIQVDWVTLNPYVENRSSPAISTTPVENRSSPAISTTPTAPAPAPIIEAQGWVIDSKGEIVLTASASTATPNNSWQTPANCHASNTSS